jgi:hypothetical protein
MILSDLKKNERKDSLEGYSNVYEVRLAGFGGKRFDSSVKTYLTNANVKYLSRDIKTYETLSEHKSWPVSNLMQREVDRSRVDSITREYLLPDKNIKYFPPIIIAFIPTDDDGNIIPLKSTESEEDLIRAKNFAFRKITETLSGDTKEFEELIRNSQNISKLQGLYVLEVLKPVSYYLVFWDIEKIHAVIIDGQHRFEALKKSALKDSKFEDFCQDLVFIEISEKIFETDSSSLVEMVRTIFIDINTNPVKVNESKNILMTDNDISSVLVQCIVDDSKIHEPNSFIRPELIDWHALDLKHSLPYITNILLLQNIFSKNFLNGLELDSSKRRIKSKNYIYKWIAQINFLFRVDELIEGNENPLNLKTLKESFDEFRKNNISIEEDDDSSEDDFSFFNYDYRIIEIVKREFNDKYSFAIVHLFNELRPFSLIIKRLSERNFLQRGSKERKALIKIRDFQGDGQNLVKDLSDSLKSEYFPLYYIFYTVLGQKALFKIFFDYLSEKIFQEKKYDRETITEYARVFVNNWNVVFDILKYSSKGITLFGGKFTGEPNPESNIQKIPDRFLKKYSEYELKNFQPQSTKLWEDIIFYNDAIIYKEKGVNNLVFILNYIYAYIENNKNKTDFFETNDKGKYQSELGKISKSISQRIYKNFDKTERESESISKHIIESKLAFIESFLDEAIKDKNIIKPASDKVFL